MFSLESKFPAVTFQNISQTATRIDATISLINAGKAENAGGICREKCELFKGRKVRCSGIDASGVANIAVQLESPKPRRPTWFRLRVARLFDAPCGVTFDKIKKQR